MSYTALYRKFRPQTFDDVCGQDGVVTTLKNQIIHNRLSHAYLFCGTRGTGKTTIAKIFARAVNCENPQDGSPCGVCASCRSISDGSSLDVIEMDAASNSGVDTVRLIVDEVTYSPSLGRFKVYIIDEVHSMSRDAFNALLKTLEEPPEYVIFILATTEANRLPVTILSRCQRYDFRRIAVPVIEDRIRQICKSEGVSIEDRAVNYIARSADGAMRDALSILDQCIAYYHDQELTYDKALEVLGAVDVSVFGEMFRLLTAYDATGAVRLLGDLILDGRELGQFVTDLTWYLRNLLLLKTAQADETVVDASSENIARMKEEAKSVSHETIMRYIRVLSELSGQLRYAAEKRVLAEITFIKLCSPEMEQDHDSLVSRIEKLENKLKEGVVVWQYAAPAAGAPEAGAMAAPAAGAAGRTREMPKALPEDIKEIASDWRRVIGVTDGLWRAYFAGSYPSIENEDTLAVVFTNDAGYDYFSKEENKKSLCDLIANETGKDVKVVVRSGGDSGDTYPDLREFVKSVDEKIDFPIEEIDGEE